MKTGALHQMLHIPQSQLIPTEILNQIHEAVIGSHINVNGHSIPVTHLLKQRAQFANSFR